MIVSPSSSRKVLKPFAVIASGNAEIWMSQSQRHLPSSHVARSTQVSSSGLMRGRITVGTSSVVPDHRLTSFTTAPSSIRDSTTIDFTLGRYGTMSTSLSRWVRNTSSRA